MPEEREKKTAFIGYKARPSQKARVERAVADKLAPDVRYVSELAERLIDEGLDRLEAQGALQ